MIWSVPKDWAGETCFILAGGPSLRGFSAARLRDHGRVITINDSWRLAPWADAFYFCDYAWFVTQLNYTIGGVRFRDLVHTGKMVTVATTLNNHPHVKVLQMTGVQGLEKNPRCLRHGCNSGYQAIGLAYHYGVRRIVLLGYDMHCDGKVTHWHNEPRCTAISFGVTLARTMLPHFPTIASELYRQKVDVINATPDSALKCWPYRALEDVLTESKQEVLTYGD